MLKFTALTRPLSAASRDQLGRLVRGHRQRLLAHHVAAGGEDLPDLRVVEVVGRGDVDDLDAIVGEDVVEGAVRLRDAEALGARRTALRAWIPGGRGPARRGVAGPRYGPCR